MRGLHFLLSSMCFLSAAPLAAQQGDCSIIRLSEEWTEHQGLCVPEGVAEITPIVYLVQGAGLTVTDLPPGVSYTISGDTLTISGTINAIGYWSADISVSGGQCTAGIAIILGQQVDPHFTCEVIGDSVVLSWPGLPTATQEPGGILYFASYSGEEVLDIQMVFTPCPGLLSLGGLPAGVPLTFTMTWDPPYPECFTGLLETGCTIGGTFIDAATADVVRALLRDDHLELVCPVRLKEVDIYNAMGQLLVAHRVNGTSVQVPVDGLPAGPFLVMVRDTDDRASALRFMKP